MSDDWKAKLAAWHKDASPQKPAKIPAQPALPAVNPPAKEPGFQPATTKYLHSEKVDPIDSGDPLKSQQESELHALLDRGEKAIDRALQLDTLVAQLTQELKREKSMRELSETNYLNALQDNDGLKRQIDELAALVANIAAREQAVSIQEKKLLQIESRSKEESKRLSSLAETLNQREELERENTTLRRSNTRLINKNTELVSANQDRLNKIDQQRAENKLIRDKLHSMTRDLERIENKNKTLSSNLVLTQLELESVLLDRNHELSIRSFETVKWLINSGINMNGRLFPNKICTHGSGPWKADDLDELLQEKGFELYNCGDYKETRKIGIIVVGSTDWDGDAIEKQINNLEDRSVKVFPQELFVAALACGVDPFDSITCEDDPEIPEFLESFGRDHPVIKYLRSLDFPWPSSSFDNTGPKISSEWEGVDESPLYRSGYTVAENEGLSQSERQTILENAFIGELQWVYSDDYMGSWGTPLTRKRLRRIAYHITMLMKRHGHHTGAIARWNSDLAWLKEKHYRPMMRFKWPVMRRG